MPTVEYDKMFVKDLRRVLAERPVAYLPIGTPEMHGEHLSYGQDGIKAHELCKCIAQKAGGAVLPPLHAGTSVPKGLNFGNIYISMSAAKTLYQEYMQELARIGFRVILAMTGHYPYCQVVAVKQVAADAADATGAWIVGFGEYELGFDLGYCGDHAGKWETSIYWHLRPDLVCMDNLPKDPNVRLIAAGPEDPRSHASRELGEKVCVAIADRAAAFVDKLLELDKDPVQSGPTHTLMNMALRNMARAIESNMASNVRVNPKYHEALAAFYACDFGRANALLQGLCRSS